MRHRRVDGKNSESIYGCDRTPLPVQNWGTSTRQGNTLYLHVFHWPADGRLFVAGLKSDPQSMHALALAPTEEPHVYYRVSPDDIEINVGQVAPDAVDSVWVLDFPADIETNPARLLAIKSEPTTLHVFDGQLMGKGIRYGDAKRTNDVINEWSDAGATVEWKVRLAAATRFKVRVNYSTATKENNGTYRLEVDGQKLTGRITPTDKPADFRTDALGEVTILAGEHTLVIRASEIAGGNLMRLRQLELVPVE